MLFIVDYVYRFHILIVLSKLELAIKSVLLIETIQEIQLRCILVYVYIHYPAKFHNLIDVSVLALTIYLWGDYTGIIDLTVPVCPYNILIHFPVNKCHNLILLSLFPLKNIFYFSNTPKLNTDLKLT